MSGTRSRKRKRMMPNEEEFKNQRKARLELELLINNSPEWFPFDLIKGKLIEFGFSERDIYDRFFQMCAFLLKYHFNCERLLKTVIVDNFASLVLKLQWSMSVSIAKICSRSIDRSCVKFTKALLNYGYFELANPNPFVDRTKARKFVKKYYLYVHRNAPCLREALVLAGNANETLTQLKLSEGRMDKGSCNARGFKRILTMTLLLKAIILKGQDHPATQDYVEGIRAYFKTVPDPHVSREEFHEFLTHLDHGQWMTDPKVIRTMADDYALLFKPESEMSFMPRSLLHLCRISVRQTLMKRNDKLLDDMVHSLFIPIELKKILLGLF